MVLTLHANFVWIHRYAKDMERLAEAKKRREVLEAKKKEDEAQAQRQAESLAKAMKKANMIAAAEEVRAKLRAKFMYYC
jgi:2,3-bisphosphoglycerate-independent phosphoglycerate mutase